MNCIIVGLLCAFATIFMINGINADDGQFELREGNCSSASVSDLIFTDHVHRYGIPFTTRDDSVHWEGDEKIFCILALSQDDASVHSTVTITEGGVNHTFVSLYFKSAKGKGFEYNIQVFGK